MTYTETINLQGAQAIVEFNYRAPAPADWQNDREEGVFEISSLKIAGSEDIANTDLCNLLWPHIFDVVITKFKEDY